MSAQMPIPRRWSSHSQAKGDWRMDPEGQWVIWADVREVIEWAGGTATQPVGVDDEVELMRAALHEQGIGCRATHKGHANRLVSSLHAIRDSGVVRPLAPEPQARARGSR